MEAARFQRPKSGYSQRTSIRWRGLRSSCRYIGSVGNAGIPARRVCATNPYHVSHIYTTSLAEAQSYIGLAFYKFDGIEGYTYPSCRDGIADLDVSLDGTDACIANEEVNV